MALVAYDDSDLSEYEEDDSGNLSTATLTNQVEETVVSERTTKETSHATDNNPNLFNLLPQPTTKKPAVVEEDDEFLHKKETVTNEKPKARITVPSLNDFKDVEGTPIAKPKTRNGKKSGLLSILPEPKNAVKSTTKSMIPHVLTQKPKPPTNTTVKKNGPTPTPNKKAKTETNVLAIDYSDGSDNDEEVENDFFSINKSNDIPVEDIQFNIDKSVAHTEPITNVTELSNQRQASSMESYFKRDEVTNHVELQIVPDHMDSNDNTKYPESDIGDANYNTYGVSGSSSNSEAVLDDEAILKLCGARGKRKREDIQIVDVNQQEVLADAREWLLKGLMDDTSKRVSSSKKKGNEPTSQQRRKHQITYLAHQAKANEVELQNQWANNRLTKRQTQSKYGF